MLVTVEYWISAERAGEFVRAMDAMRSFRRREGAVHWGPFRDLADPDRCLETFLVPSWAEHLRQHARAFAFQQQGVEPVASHLIAARALDGRTPAEPPHAELS